MVYCDAYLMKIQIFDAEYLQLQLYFWLLYWFSHNQTKLKKRIQRPLFFKFLEEKLFFLSSSSSTRHIIYHYEINDKFCTNLSKSFLRFVKFYNILRHVYYFRWIIIQLNISACLKLFFYHNLPSISLHSLIFILNLSAI